MSKLGRQPAWVWMLILLAAMMWWHVRAEAWIEWPVPGRPAQRIDFHGYAVPQPGEFALWQSTGSIANASTVQASGDGFKVWAHTTPDSTLPMYYTVAGDTLCWWCPEPVVERVYDIEMRVVGLAEAGLFSSAMGESMLYVPAYNMRMFRDRTGVWIRVDNIHLDMLALANGDSMYIFPDPCLVWHATFDFPLMEVTE